jgi:hypothetical protein
MRSSPGLLPFLRSWPDGMAAPFRTGNAIWENPYWFLFPFWVERLFVRRSSEAIEFP